MVRLRFRGDTPDANLQMWELKQDGFVVDGSVATAERPFGRAIDSAEAVISLEKGGAPSRVDVAATDTQGRKTTSTVYFACTAK